MALADDEIAAWAAKQGFVSKDGTDPGAAEAAERLIGLAGELGDMKAFESPFYQGSPEVRVVLTRVEAKGAPFDPTHHEAVAHVETAEHEPNAVMEEHQPGYRLKDRLLRPALVSVAKPKTS